LKEQIETLQQQKKDAESLRDIALQDEKMTSSGLKWYTDLRDELRKYGIPMDQIQQLAKAMKGLKELNYDIAYVITCVTDFQAFGAMQAKLQEDVRSFTITKHDLEEEIDYLDEIVSIHRQTVVQVQELKNQGFSFKDLKQLSHTIKEIANANSILEIFAVKKFITDIEQQYDDKLGFESKIEKLKYEISYIERDKQMRGNRENVPLPELKLSLIKAIETVVRVLPRDNTVEILNSAKKALEDTLNDIV
ncbi:MAG TPA: hypothetical protein VEH06_03545, partial [Candidatus Bathyarchaeia archaeon]|nr:hypothetical protein [Candidatus Bathyarchaeia archaeon]